MIRVVGKRGKGSVESQLDEAAKGVDFVRIDCTSGNPDTVMKEGLSPFFLGPVDTYDGLKAERFERAWQCSKVFAGFADAAGNPLPEWFAWRDRMWADASNADHMAIRFPAGKENANPKQTLYSYWKVDGEFKRLGYIDARKHIYLPVYAKAVVKTEAYRCLCAMRDEGKNLLLVDFDGYNPHHPRYNFTYNDVLHCPLLKMGHGFVLAMLLEGVIKVDEECNVTYADGLMDDPHKFYSPDLRKLTDEQKQDRAASCAGVSVDELQTLTEGDRKLLKRAYSREACKARGISRAAWERLPLAEKLRVARLEEQTHEPVSVAKEDILSKNVASDTIQTEDGLKENPVETSLERPSDLSGYFNAGALADATGAIPGWAATDRADIVRLWVPKTVISIGSFAFKGCANLEEVVFEESSDEIELTIGTMSFAGCPKLVSVLLSAAVRSIGSGAFRDDGSLATLQIDPCSKPIQVGSHAFDNCPSPDDLQKQIANAKIKVNNKPVSVHPSVPTVVATSAEFDAFWEEFTDWWGATDGEEILTLKKGKTSYALKCGWSEGTLVVAMITPWSKEWDYVQLYRGMFGWGDVGNGFDDGRLRKKVAKLLLDELIRRNTWMGENSAALAERDREIEETRKAEGEGGEKPPSWFAEYRWARNRMAEPGEGEMRLYVKGDDHIRGAPVQCEWALSDMRKASWKERCKELPGHHCQSRKESIGGCDVPPISPTVFFE